ncbi:MAG TPA: TlpA disulfide reductase family protein [Planctomycetaceae bacterium]|jgi:thiol-disulfide isomerase/thioredoxin
MLRRLLLICVPFLLWGCNKSASLERGRSAVAANKRSSTSAGTDKRGKGPSPIVQVAHLLETNAPFSFDFDVEDVVGNRISKADLAGKVLIVDLWGTWCGPCRKEVPHFVALNKKYRDRGLAIVGLNSEQIPDMAEAAEQVRKFCKSAGVNYPCAVVGEEFLAQIPDLQGFPTTLFIDRTGQVRLRVVGYHDMAFLQAAVEALLQEDSVTNAGG